MTALILSTGKKVLMLGVLALAAVFIAVLAFRGDAPRLFKGASLAEVDSGIEKLEPYVKRIEKGENIFHFDHKKALADGHPEKIVRLQKEMIDRQNEMIQRFKVGLGSVFEPVNAEKYPLFAEYVRISDEYYSELHENKRPKPGESYLTADLGNVERSLREMEPYVKYAGSEGVRMQTLDEKSAGKAGRSEGSILLMKEIVAYQNEMMRKIKAGKTDVFGPVDKEKYPRIYYSNKAASDFHGIEKLKPGEGYLTADLGNVERSLREMEPYVKYAGSGGVRMQTLDEKSAGKAGRSEESILLGKEIVAYQNEMMRKIKAGKTGVFGPVDKEKYPRIYYSNKAASDFHKKTGEKGPEYHACGTKSRPVPHFSPSREYYESEDPERELLNAGFHHTPPYACGEYGKSCSKTDFTRGRDYSGDYGYCDSPAFRDHARIESGKTYSVQYGEPNPEIHSYSWPYPSWPVYVNWWHEKY
jgi:hypothetical protein